MDWAACLTIRAWGARRGAAKSTLFGLSIPLFNLPSFIDSTRWTCPSVFSLFAFFPRFSACTWRVFTSARFVKRRRNG